MMSHQLTADLADTAHVEDPHPAGEPEVSPMVAFGLRTAALAGLAIPVGLLVGHLVAGNAGDVDAAVPLALTTCCPTFPV
ncbi:hypothetical protein FHG89_05150 [Micromonospora orduensis]|uniref:Uncharacterized protein n=1 Tax=Micromonospora orduensis TaxID=1420891 RepID=A0A5C4QXW7_9ACTN|nr:hypothetical protein [Micromonospora orduensis]TNH30906.1 hypothetical protein FHG89_05150 [Micromonospora orduensis]